MALFNRKMGVDLGTINVIIYQDGQILLQEPSMVALTIEDERIVAIGQEARDMFGRHPDHIEVVRPLRDGVIADYEHPKSLSQRRGTSQIMRPSPSGEGPGVRAFTAP